jgi:hypothetical protein
MPIVTMEHPTGSPARRPERWSVDAGNADVATLDIPADLQRDRDFEIDCRFVVRAPAGAQAPTHAMTVLVDGAHQWSRSIATANPGASDSLDYHLRRRVPAGQPLRITATTEVRGAARLRLLIEAEES